MKIRNLKCFSKTVNTNLAKNIGKAEEDIWQNLRGFQCRWASYESCVDFDEQYMFTG